MIDLNNIDRPQELSDHELENLSKQELILKWKQMQSYVDNLEKLNRDYLTKLNTKSFELAKLKNVLMNTISTTKDISTEQVSSISNNELAQAESKPRKLFLVDPCINSIIIELKKELDEMRKKKDDLQNELNSTKFNPESHLTKRLMFKCNKLLEENEQLGKMISSGNVALLENDLAYHKQLLNEASENEQKLDNEMDVMQANILMLQQQLNPHQVNS